MLIQLNLIETDRGQVGVVNDQENIDCLCLYND